jgi:hypothetical protein
MTPSLSIADTAHHSELVESPKVTPLIPQSQGLGSSDEAPIGGDLAQIPKEIPLKQAP